MDAGHVAQLLLVKQAVLGFKHKKALDVDDDGDLT